MAGWFGQKHLVVARTIDTTEGENNTENQRKKKGPQQGAGSRGSAPGFMPLRTVNCSRKKSALLLKKSHHVLQPPRREKPSHATVSRMTALGAARGLTEIRPRSARDLQGPPQAKRARRRRNGVWGVPTFAIVKTALFSFQIPFALGVARYLPDICLQSASVILQPTRCSGPGVRACVRVLAGVRLLKTNHTVYRQARNRIRAW